MAAIQPLFCWWCWSRQFPRDSREVGGDPAVNALHLSAVKPLHTMKAPELVPAVAVALLLLALPGV